MSTRGSKEYLFQHRLVLYNLHFVYNAICYRSFSAWFLCVLLFLAPRPLCPANPCFLGYVIPQSVHSNLKAFSGGNLTMSLSVVSDMGVVGRMCCTFVLGIEIDIPADCCATESRCVYSVACFCYIFVSQCCIISIFKVS